MKRALVLFAALFGLVGVSVVHATTPFTERWVSTGYVTGLVYDSTTGYDSDEVCLGPAQWHVTGTVSGHTFHEDWIVGSGTTGGYFIPQPGSFYFAGTLITDINGTPNSGLYTDYRFKTSYLDGQVDVSQCTHVDNGNWTNTSHRSNVVFFPTGIYGVSVTRYDPRGSDSWTDYTSYTALRAMPKEWYVVGTIQ